ncbi:ABC transporter substrate-binding protein [Pseudooceanicola sp. CBS1P-1]|uniref:SsuA/THI5-like domain-containing protein n=1 Tax=Pseudooceanicola albus TaxID=2692189 RepID=A0A6L7G5V7_9RHOB|nr:MULTISPECIES: ABC transporter substrate-binding protein [Pseudooceanicola]MBT9384952.1 ABC transporter substrate-binding protein [Pseudooceanicola endophyticus]MXN18053.1 hypothetical protein [Pseudooceanicola albus]
MKRLCAASALIASLASPSFADDKITFQLDWLPGGDKAPIYVCVQEGFCKDAGFDVTIASGRGSSEAITKLATGVAQFGSAGLDGVMAAKATEKVPVEAIMSIYNMPPDAFFTTKDKGIAAIADVKGKKVVTSPFTSSNVLLPLILKANGLSDSDITLTKADPGALGPLMFTGQQDVAIAWLTNVSRYTNQAKEAGKELVVLPWAEAGLETYSAALVTNSDYASANPELTKRFVAAFKKSLEFAQANPDKAAADVVAMVPELTVDDVKAMWEDTSKLIFNDMTEKLGLGSLDATRVASTWARVAEAQGLDPESLDPETAINRSYLPQ